MTIKQKKVAEDLLENVGKPIGQAMLDAGYSPSTAKNPDHLTRTKGWIQTMEKYFPDERLAKVGDEGLNATKIHSSYTEPDKEIPDHPTRHKYWETILKMKRYVGPEIIQQFNSEKMEIEFIDKKDASSST